MKGTLRFGNHLPVLIRVVAITKGPIVELGGGYFSTPFLHWACFPTKRKLETYENKKKFYDMIKGFSCDFHKVVFVKDWDDIDLSKPWSIALIDHSPGLRRPTDIKRLFHADYIIAHDTENKSDKDYRYSTILKHFKYRWKYRDSMPHTSIFSNKYEVSGIMK